MRPNESRCHTNTTTDPHRLRQTERVTQSEIERHTVISNRLDRRFLYKYLQAEGGDGGRGLGGKTVCRTAWYQQTVFNRGKEMRGLGVWKTTTFHNQWVVFNNFGIFFFFSFFYESVRKGRVNEHRLFCQGGHKRTCADLHCISCPLWLTAPAEGERWGGASRLLRGRIGSPTFYYSRYERLYSTLAFKDSNCAQILTFISRAEVNDTHFMYISVRPCFVIGTDACTLSVRQHSL